MLNGMKKLCSNITYISQQFFHTDLKVTCLMVDKWLVDVKELTGGCNLGIFTWQTMEDNNMDSVAQ